MFNNCALNPFGSYSPFVDEIQKDIETSEGFWNLAIKPIAKLLSWVEVYFEELAVPLKGCKFLIGRIKAVKIVCKLPKKFTKTCEAINSWKNTFFEGVSWELGAKTTDVYIRAASMMSVIADTVQLARDGGFISLSSRQILVLDVIGFMSSFSLFCSSIKGLFKYGRDFFCEDVESAFFQFAFLKITGQIVLLAISVFGMFTFATGGVSNRIVLLSLSTVNLILSTFTRYYKRAYINPTFSPKNG